MQHTHFPQIRTKPTPASPRGNYPATVVRNTRICTDHYRLTLALPHFPPSTPGQFIQLDCSPQTSSPSSIPSTQSYTSFEWGGDHPSRPSLNSLDPDFASPHAYLRRPFSIAARRNLPQAPSPSQSSVLTPQHSVELDVIHRVVGKGTAFLESLSPGNPISVLGPLGNGFHIPPETQLALLVGGGVGIPPMFYLAETIHAANRNAVAFVGAQRKDLVPLTISPCSPAPSPDGSPVLNATEFADHAFPTVITTDDGSMGMKGFVTQALTSFLQKLVDKKHSEFKTLNSEFGKITIFCCGPTPMMKATAKVAAAFNVPCQVSLEQPMACGMGTCQSCVIKWHGTGPTALPPNEWKYKLTCTDGPVFNPQELLW